MFKNVTQIEVPVQVLEVTSKQTDYGLKEDVVLNTEDGICPISHYVNKGCKCFTESTEIALFKIYANNGKIGCSISAL